MDNTISNDYDLAKLVGEILDYSRLQSYEQEPIEGSALGKCDFLGISPAKRESLARVNSHLVIRAAHRAIYENLHLKEKIKQHEQNELGLRLIEQRLNAILDLVHAAILVINDDGTVSFSNHICDELLGYQPLCGYAIKTLFKPQSCLQLRAWLDDLKQGEEVEEQQLYSLNSNESWWVQPEILDVEGRRQLLLLLNEEAVSINANNKQALGMVNTLNEQCLHLCQLEDSLIIHTPDLLQALPELQTHIRDVRFTLDQISRLMQPLSHDGESRAQLVFVLNLAIDFWCHQTGSNKAELARQSGEWKIYVNEDGWERTQTLDRYLSLDTLPKRPRWKLVIRTCEFVLIHCPGESVQREHLQKELAVLRAQS